MSTQREVARALTGATNASDRVAAVTEARLGVPELLAYIASRESVIDQLVRVAAASSPAIASTSGEEQHDSSVAPSTDSPRPTHYGPLSFQGGYRASSALAEANRVWVPTRLDADCQTCVSTLVEDAHVRTAHLWGRFRRLHFRRLLHLYRLWRSRLQCDDSQLWRIDLVAISKARAATLHLYSGVLHEQLVLLDAITGVFASLLHFGDDVTRLFTAVRERHAHLSERSLRATSDTLEAFVTVFRLTNVDSTVVRRGLGGNGASRAFVEAVRRLRLRKPRLFLSSITGPPEKIEGAAEPRGTSPTTRQRLAEEPRAVVEHATAGCGAHWSSATSAARTGAARQATQGSVRVRPAQQNPAILVDPQLTRGDDDSCTNYSPTGSGGGLRRPFDFSIEATLRSGPQESKSGTLGVMSDTANESREPATVSPHRPAATAVATRHVGQRNSGGGSSPRIRPFLCAACTSLMARRQRPTSDCGAAGCTMHRLWVASHVRVEREASFELDLRPV